MFRQRTEKDKLDELREYVMRKPHLCAYTTCKRIRRQEAKKPKRDPLRTYDAWAKDKDDKPQTWEQYMSKGEAR